MVFSPNFVSLNSCLYVWQKSLEQYSRITISRSLGWNWDIHLLFPGSWGRFKTSIEVNLFVVEVLKFEVVSLSFSWGRFKKSIEGIDDGGGLSDCAWFWGIGIKFLVDARL